MIWEDSTFSIDDLRRVYEELKPEIEKNKKVWEKYEWDVLRYVKKIT